MIKDRGTKKWTSMMLPEHVSMLRAMDMDNHRNNKPALDEYQLQELDERLKVALEFKLPVIFELWYDGFTEDLEGVVNKIDEINKKIYVHEITGDLQKINYSSIISVDFAD